MVCKTIDNDDERCKTNEVNPMIAPAYWLERLSRPWHKEGIMQASETGRFSELRMWRPSELELARQSMRDKAAQRENSGYMKSVESFCKQQYKKTPKQKQQYTTDYWVALYLLKKLSL